MVKHTIHFTLGTIIFSLFFYINSYALEPPHDLSNGINCVDCHGSHSGGMFGGIGPMPIGAEQEAICKSCHNPAGTASAMSNVANHVVNAGETIIDCGSCHDPHGPQTTIDPHTGIEAINLKLIRDDTGKYFPAALEPAIFQLRPAHFAFDESSAPWNGICQSCHTMTAHHTNDNSADHQHNMGSNCIGCHTHESGFQASECTDCHNQPQGSRRQIVGPGGDFDQTSTHIAGTVTSDDCTTCHDLSMHQKGTVLMRDPENGAVWTGTRTNFCLTCHGSTPPAGVIFPASSGTGYDKSAYVNSTHQQNMGPNSCSHCHNAHGSPYASLLKNNYVKTDYNQWSPGNGDFGICWTCHNENTLMDKNFNNAFEDLHEKHVKGEDSSCITCHDVHSSYDSGEPGLISFEYPMQNGFDMFWTNGSNQSTAFWISGSTGNCMINCHGKNHKPKDYKRTPSPDTNCLACHLANGKYAHSPVPAYCGDCHWDQRPPEPHPQTRDCTECHHDPGGSWLGATFDHIPIPASCAQCHASDRPAPPHPQGTDCVACHTDPGGSWAGSVTNYTHDPPPASCTQCHETDRPADPHPQTGDCAECHSDPGGSWPGSVTNFDHDPPPSSCAYCHEADRPAAPHRQTTDCVGCHSDPGGSWTGSVTFYTHDPPPISCAQCHETDRPGAPHPQGTDCSGCHNDPGGLWSNVVPHPESTSDCNKCHFNKQTGQPDLKALHNDNCRLCHTEGYYDRTFLGPVGTWDSECNSCHNANISQTGNYPAHKQGHRCVLCHGGERDIPDSAVYDSVRLHKDHSKNANCVVCHGFIPNTNVQIGSGNRDNCALCHGQGAYSSAGIIEIHEGMVKQGTSCLECHFDQRPPIDVVTGPPVGSSTVICQICHSNESPSEFTNNMDRMHKKHLKKKLECGECHIDAVLQDDRVPMPASVDDSRRALIDRAGYNECSFCHSGSKSGNITTVHRKHHKDQWQWCYNCHEGSDQRPIGVQPPVTQPSETCALCHANSRQYSDTSPFDLHHRHAKRAKCYACHQGTPPIFNWPGSWR